jgi:ABC-2 type transport system ATP-binding protein
MRNVITQLGKEKTVMLSTHVMQEVEAMCSKVIIINGGQIIANDNIGLLKTNFSSFISILVEFSSELNKAQLLQIEGVTSAENKGGNSWKIQSNQAQLRQQISQFALSNNIEILELSTDKNSLEDIFRNLTTNVGHI